MSELQPSVIYRRGPISIADYEEAIEALQNARDQLTALNDGVYQPCCAVCEDTDHYHQMCHHNPLVIARRRADDEETWRCYHCGFLTRNHEEAEEHFGLNQNATPACMVESP